MYGTDYATPDGTCIRDYIHVSDLVRAHSDALRYLRASGPSATLNCGYGRGFSVLEVIDTVKKAAGVDFPVEFAPRRPGDPAQIVAACERARTLLGWQPQLDDLTTIVDACARLGAQAAGPQEGLAHVPREPAPPNESRACPDSKGTGHAGGRHFRLK